MVTFLVILQVFVAIFLILVVLLQPGNKGGVGAALGGAGGDTVFGGRGANTFLAKLTVGAAVIFMVCNFSLSFLSTARSALGKSVVEDLASESVAPAPAAPAATAPAVAPAAPATDTESAVPAAPAAETK